MISALSPRGVLQTIFITIIREERDMKKKILSNDVVKEQRPQENTSDVTLHERIARKAYELYQKRGAIHGRDLEDWLTAECLLQEELLTMPLASEVSRGKVSVPRKKSSRSMRTGA